MSDPQNGRANDPEPSFAEQAEASQPGIVREFIDFLAQNKKWWLTPILLVLLLMGALVVFAITNPAAGFIYTLF